MAILNRYNEIMSRKIDISKLIDCDNPVEEADKLMRTLADDLEKVKSYMSDVNIRAKIAEDLLNQAKININQTGEQAIKSIQDGNYDDAKLLLKNKSNLEKEFVPININYILLKDDLCKLNDMYDILMVQISNLSSQKTDIKIKAAIKKAQHS